MKFAKNIIVIEASKPRDPYALLAKRRRAAKMKDRRQERGGAKNRQQEYLKENE